MWADAGVVFRLPQNAARQKQSMIGTGQLLEPRPVPRRTEPAGEARSFLTGESNTVTIMVGR